MHHNTFRYASKSKAGNTEPQTVIHISCNLEPVDFQHDTATDTKVWDIPKNKNMYIPCAYCPSSSLF